MTISSFIRYQNMHCSKNTQQLRWQKFCCNRTASVEQPAISLCNFLTSATTTSNANWKQTDCSRAHCDLSIVRTVEILTCLLITRYLFLLLLLLELLSIFWLTSFSTVIEVVWVLNKWTLGIVWAWLFTGPVLFLLPGQRHKISEGFENRHWSVFCYVCVCVKKKPMQSSSLTDSVASDMSTWWPKTSGKEDDKPAAVPATQSQGLSVMASGSSQPGSAPPSLPQSPSARRGVNLLDEVVSPLATVFVVFGPGRQVRKRYSSCSSSCWNQFSKNA